MRKLASIQKIVKIEPIPNKDKVELATVLGWNVIVSKGEFKEGDLCIYFEPDSLLYPSDIWDSFLASRKYKIKTIKMCGVISQGLVLPLSIVSKLNPTAKYKAVEDTDLTEILNVKHFEKGDGVDNDEKVIITFKKSKNPLVNFMMKFNWFRKIYLYMFGSKPKGQFPSSIVAKTDEENIQSLKGFLDQHRGKRFYISEKLEGQSSSYMLYQKEGMINKYNHSKEFMVCSHNVKLPHSDTSSWWSVAKLLDIENKLISYQKETGIHLAVQGEVIGEKIQGNIYKIKGYDFYIFNVKDIDSNRYYTLTEKQSFCEKIGLKLVPIIDDNFIITEEVTPQMLLEMANGKSVLYDTSREGFVFRCYDNDRISFKAKSPEYLLKEK